MFIFESTREHQNFHLEFSNISKDALVFKAPARTPIGGSSANFDATSQNIGQSSSSLGHRGIFRAHTIHTHYIEELSISKICVGNEE
jgi:hypothetical protein